MSRRTLFAKQEAMDGIVQEEPRDAAVDARVEGAVVALRVGGDEAEEGACPRGDEETT